VREESEVLKVEVPLICPSTAGVPAHREGRYYNPCLQCGALFVKFAFEGKPISLSTVLFDPFNQYYCYLKLISER
jgi:hypothetical protein